MRKKTSRTAQEKKQIAHGKCYGNRYNPKTGKTEICEHREECSLYQKYVLFNKERLVSFQYFEPIEDHVGNQPIKDWRKCEVWKTHKHTKTDVSNG